MADITAASPPEFYARLREQLVKGQSSARKTPSACAPSRWWLRVTCYSREFLALEKTLLAKSLARALALEYGRVQFHA